MKLKIGMLHHMSITFRSSFLHICRCAFNIWVEYYIWAKIRQLRHSVLNLLGVKIYISCKISKFCRHSRATKTDVDKIFGIWIFSFIWKDKIVDITWEKLNWAHVIFIHKSYNKIVDKNLFISPKTGQKWNFTFFGL